MLVWMIPALALVILIAVLVFLLAGRGEKSASALSGAETGAAGTQTEPTVTETAQTAEETGETLSETAEESEETPSSAVPAEQNVAAEVGSMDDAEDPQTPSDTNGDGQTGAAVDVGALQVPEGETGDVTLGIDVSKYQGTIDWGQVKASGVEFAMIRVGYRTKSTGIIYEDPGARYNLQEATANGIKAGAYFFSSAVNRQEAQEEAAWLCSFIAKYRITYPVAYNCEDFQSADSRQYGLTKEERTQLACTFLDSVAAAGYTPMFYASRNEMEGSAQWDMETLGSRYRVWVSQYPEKPFPETPASSYSGAHAMWQYTSQGQVAGIRGSVDVNVAYFGYSKEAQAKDQNPAEIVEANPEVGMNFTEVDETVTAKDQTNLRNLPTTEGSQVVYTLKNGETAQRTATSPSGWDRVIYNGQRLYAVHSFLTTELGAKSQPAGGSGGAAGQSEGSSAEKSQGSAGAGSFQAGGLTFRTVNEAVTARDKVNLRDNPSTETGNIVGTLSYGEAVVRTGVSGSSDTGWSRLEVNGQIVYASSRLLATSMDYKEKEKPTAENPEAGMHFVAASGTVKAKSGETNLRNLPTTNEPSQVVAQLTGDATAQRLAVDPDRGWTRLSYNGQVLYAVSGYLTAAE
ncbi:MAG: GH25 family lysozyme [Eubacteriales bacterium]|nr:GH25 family lysozyme [Eubacteriales bacterium]